MLIPAFAAETAQVASRATSAGEAGLSTNNQVFGFSVWGVSENAKDPLPAPNKALLQLGKFLLFLFFLYITSIILNPETPYTQQQPSRRGPQLNTFNSLHPSTEEQDTFSI